jgi:RNA 2',3'-cyclic 3'-phosphodiesterase
MPHGQTARLFLALDLPPGLREGLAGWARAATSALSGPRGRAGAGVRLLAPELMHLTLCFLGSRPAGEIEPLCAALAGCGAPSVQLSVGAPRWLPPRRPRALPVAVGDRQDALGGLRELLEQALASAGSWEPERRRFRPHITVARMRAGFATAGAGTLTPTPGLCFAGDSVSLYRSWLAPSGASYEPLATLPLEGPAG